MRSVFEVIDLTMPLICFPEQSGQANVQKKTPPERDVAPTSGRFLRFYFVVMLLLSGVFYKQSDQSILFLGYPFKP